MSWDSTNWRPSSDATVGPPVFNPVESGLSEAATGAQQRAGGRVHFPKSVTFPVILKSTTTRPYGSAATNRRPRPAYRKTAAPQELKKSHVRINTTITY
jgi:hypothetical protein